MRTIEIQTLSNWLNKVLQVSKFHEDYSPNGLQVEGKKMVGRIITGVSANEALLRFAIKKNADAILVHHGWFWKNQDSRVRGVHKKRLELALKHNLNIFAYHLPLDMHISLGNNIQLAHILDIKPCINDENSPITCGYQSLIWIGNLEKTNTLENFGKHIHQKLDRVPLIIGNQKKRIRSVAWCTGAAQNMFLDAVEENVDAFITGEISEHTVHLSIETNVAFIAAGHHATERYGIQALGKTLQKEFGIEVEFVDVENPV